MKRSLVAVAAFAMALGTTTDRAVGQLAGNPVYAAVPSVGISLGADYGRGLEIDESAQTDYFGARLTLGFPVLSLWVGGGAYDSGLAGSESEMTVGGGAALNILKAPSLPFSLSLQMGGATVSCGSGCTTLNGYAGPAIKINVVGAVNSVQPWIMPRVHVTRFSMTGANVNQVGFGGSAGINLNLPLGLGVHGVLDFAVFQEAESGAIVAEKRSPLIVGGGVHYAVTIPSFGVL